MKEPLRGAMATETLSIRVAVVRSPWLNQIGQGTQVEALISAWFGAPDVIELAREGEQSNNVDFSCLLADGNPAFSVLVVPGGNDRKLWSSIVDPQRASQQIQAFVARGGGYVGICAGMCLASQGYWDVEGRLPAEQAERKAEFAHFLGLFPSELLNLHRLRKVDLCWNDALDDSHPMRSALSSATLVGGRFNDGNVVVEPPPAGTELLLRYASDEAWSTEEVSIYS